MTASIPRFPSRVLTLFRQVATTQGESAVALLSDMGGGAADGTDVDYG